jgi:hypothetical protein
LVGQINLAKNGSLKHLWLILISYRNHFEAGLWANLRSCEPVKGGTFLVEL